MKPLLADIRSLISRNTRAGTMEASFMGLRLNATSSPTAPVNTVYEPLFALVAQGAKCAVLGGQVFEYGAGQFLVVSVDLPVVSRVIRASREEPYLSVAVSLPPAAIASLLLETPAGGGTGAAVPGLAVNDAPNDLLDVVARLLRLLERPDDVAILQPMLERELLWRLLMGVQGPMVRQIGLVDSRLSQISRAIRSIRTRYAEPLRIEELAAVSAMSPSTFHRNFRAVTSMSPLQYQKQIRLREARTRLISNAKDVATVGFEVGYDSPSQFSREYSRLFGAPPAKDARRLQASPGPEREIA